MVFSKFVVQNVKKTYLCPLCIVSEHCWAGVARVWGGKEGVNRLYCPIVWADGPPGQCTRVVTVWCHPGPDSTGTHPTSPPSHVWHQKCVSGGDGRKLLARERVLINVNVTHFSAVTPRPTLTPSYQATPASVTSPRPHPASREIGQGPQPIIWP